MNKFRGGFSTKWNNKVGVSNIMSSKCTNSVYKCFINDMSA